MEALSAERLEELRLRGEELQMEDLSEDERRAFQRALAGGELSQHLPVRGLYAFRGPKLLFGYYYAPSFLGFSYADGEQEQPLS
jgi:hypothetical protein